MGSYNTKGLKRSMEEVEKIFERLDILFLTETWIRKQDLDLQHMMDEYIVNPSQQGNKRGFGGVGLLIKEQFKYKVIWKYATKNIQAITIRLQDASLTGIYMSPCTRTEEAEEVFDKIRSVSRGAAIIIGDLNARHTMWDVKSNSKGRWLTKWTAKHRWNIGAPKDPTFFINDVGTSTLDITVSKGIPNYNVTVAPMGTFTGSDHQPISLTFTTNPERSTDQGQIPKSARTKPETLSKAKILYKSAFRDLEVSITDCTDKRKLEECYQKLCDTILSPWQGARERKPGRYRTGWCWILDQKSRLRRKYYRRAKVRNDQAAWESYTRIDGEIKTAVKERKERRRKQMIGALSKAKPQDVSGWTRKLVNEAQENLTPGNHPELDPGSFTAHMATKAGEGFIVTQLPFVVDEEFELLVKEAIIRAPKRKASGSDELFTEAFNCAPEQMAKLLTAVWKKCTDLRCIPDRWAAAQLIPLYKKGNKNDPVSYRPISLLSHGRKVIESAINRRLCQCYRNNVNQLGFQKITGTEIAVARHISLSRTLQHSAVLDLTGAYDRVPRERLFHEVQKRTPANTAAMISAVLSPVIISTRGDATLTTGKITKGVPQGSPLSPILFNIFMDSYADWLTKERGRWKNRAEDWEVTLFADDVKLMAKEPGLLQDLLWDSEKWANETGMLWSIKKCHILTTPDRPMQRFELCGETIQIATKTCYLGVLITNNGVLAEGSTERVKKARFKVQLLRKLGLHAGIVSAKALLDICETFIYSTATYGIHLTPPDHELYEAWAKLERDVLILALGCFTESRRGRLRDVSKLPSLQEVKGLRWNGLVLRLVKRAAAKPEDMKAQKDCSQIDAVNAYLGHQKRWTRAEINTRRAEDDSRRQRKLPNAKGRKDIPCMYIIDLPTKRASFLWYCGLFPTRNNTVHNTSTAAKDRAKNHLKRLMTQNRWNVEDKAKVKEAFATLRA